MIEEVLGLIKDATVPIGVEIIPKMIFGRVLLEMYVLDVLPMVSVYEHRSGLN